VLAGNLLDDRRLAEAHFAEPLADFRLPVQFGDPA
jgi:hypothetical protein